MKKTIKRCWVILLVTFAMLCSVVGCTATEEISISFKDNMEIAVYGNDERIILVARYDNLGKGASGAAIECMNIVMNTEKTKGLNI